MCPRIAGITSSDPDHVPVEPGPEEKSPHALQVEFPRLLDEALTHIPRLLDKYLKAIHFLWQNGKNQKCSNGKNRHENTFRIQ
jgi:hypothetical protein